jgi:AcrR family transcriptional regulator
VTGFRNTGNKDIDRREQILRCVASLLQEDGARATDVESIVAKAGVSDVEVRRYFGGFNELVVEMASQLTDSLLMPLNASPMDQALNGTLLRFGTGLAAAYGASHLAGLYRIALTDASRHVDLGKEFYLRGPGRVTEALAAYFQAGQRAGLVKDGDTRLLADHFLALLRDRLDLSGSSPNREGEPSAVAAKAVDVFCNGIAKEVS